MRLLAILIVMFSALTIQAQDWPADRSRGRVPAPTREVLAALDLVAPILSEDTIVVSSRLSSCKSGDRGSLTQAHKTISGYFAAYYAANDTFAVGRVLIGPRFVGYLIQAPGMYSLTVIDLWVYDATRRNWLKPIELSEDWGDAGEYYYADALLLDLDRDGYKDIVKRGTFGWRDPAGEKPAQVIFDLTVNRTFFKNGFRDSGSAPKHLKERLVSIDASTGCR